MKVLIAAAELSPLARTGGLGEAVAGIASGVAERGHDVTVVMPAYRHLAGVGEPGPGIGYARTVRTHRLGDVTVLLVDDPPAFDREGIYGPRPGEGYDDQWFRFGRFSAVVGALSGDADVVHLHDAHAGPAALIADRPTVFTVHNAAYAILGPLHDTAQLLGAGFAAVEPEGALEWWGQANFLKAGLRGAHVSTTVSPTFAAELADDDTISSGLDGVIRSLPVPMVGITNGIDPVAWNPVTDPTLARPFSADDLRGRALARRRLLDEAGLDDGFVLGNVGRMAEQKGLGLLDAHIDALVDEGVRLVLVGNGELDHVVDGWADRHPRAVWHAEYEERLSRMVSAGADAYLMPSRFEPCGIGQMYAMRYGAVPVVRLTGGLADTVIDCDEDPEHATGFGFRLFEPIELVKTIRRAIRTYQHQPDLWQRLQERGMTVDFSWSGAADRYIDVYRQAMALRP